MVNMSNNNNIQSGTVLNTTLFVISHPLIYSWIRINICNFRSIWIILVIINSCKYVQCLKVSGLYYLFTVNVNKIKYVLMCLNS
jgi:hypothetical protein